MVPSAPLPGNEYLSEGQDMPQYEVEPGVCLYAEDFGDGPAIFFTSAGIQTRKMWEHQAAELALRYRTVTYDWRGTGRSDRPRSPFNVDIAVNDLCRLVEMLNVAPAVLVGHGIGCHVTLLAAHRRPELVSRMVLVSGAPWYTGDLDDQGGFSEDFTRWWGTQTANKGIHIAQAYAELYERFLFHRDPGPAVGHSVLEQALDWPLYVFKQYTSSMLELDHREILPQLRWPTLIIQGRHDNKQRYGGGVYLASHIPNARLVSFEESAHMPQIEEMELFNETIDAFVQKG